MGKKKGGAGKGNKTKNNGANDERSQVLRPLPPSLGSQSNTSRQRTSRAQSEESRFSKLSPPVLENLNLIATYTTLHRPIAPIMKRFNTSQMGNSDELRLPKKPRWHHDLTAKAVQCNEDAVFQDWLSATDDIMAERFPLTNGVLARPMEVKNLPTVRNPSDCLLPSLFERNVQVYRQLWRVIERSDVLLVLLDARCPLLHLPPSLEGYLKRYASVRTILVLTKKDIVGEQVASQWKTYLEERYGWTVVVTESYRREARQEGQGKRTRFTPFLSADSRTNLFTALKQAHKRLTTPPQRVRDDPVKLHEWKPPCTTSIDWTQVQNQHSIIVEETNESPKSSQFTIGLIGQPNVGKSSLLNALIGSKVVRASRTPGKTKHFQTHQLASNVVLCDSPGLVFPSGAGQELQVLGAILPISQVQAITTVVRFVADLMPLEKILKIDLPPDDQGSDTWTATKILEALCIRHGYKTAKAGRWDLNRAGNALVRSLAEGRIQWAFFPPACDVNGDERGIWLESQSNEPASIDDEEGEEGDDDEEEEEDELGLDKPPRSCSSKSVTFDVPEKLQHDHDDHSDSDSESDTDDEAALQPSTSMFNALAVEGPSDSDDDDGDDDDDSTSSR